MRLTLQNAPLDAELTKLCELSEKVEVQGHTVALDVPRDDVPHQVGELWRQFDIEDLAVEDIEIESLIRDLFTRQAT